jgi:hypothetical protein
MLLDSVEVELSSVVELEDSVVEAAALLLVRATVDEAELSELVGRVPVPTYWNWGL